jgi:uncharacterized protein with HEPN domain
MKRHDPGRDHDVLIDIADHCDYIVKLVGNRNFADYVADRAFRAAVERWVFNIGEATKRLSVETKSKYDVDWRGIIRMRDRLGHHYDEVDHMIMWETATRYVPDLLEKLTIT